MLEVTRLYMLNTELLLVPACGGLPILSSILGELRMIMFGVK